MAIREEQELAFIESAGTTPSDSTVESLSVTREPDSRESQELAFIESAKAQPQGDAPLEQLPQWAQDIGSIMKGGVETGQALLGAAPDPFETRTPDYSRIPDTARSQFLKRAGRFGVTAGAGGLGQGVKSVLGAATGGTVAEQLGLGPLGQAIFEVIGGSAANLFKKDIAPSKKKISFGGEDVPQKEVVGLGRKLGLKEEQIAPIVQPEKKFGFFSSAADKGKKTQKILHESRKGISKIYNDLFDHPDIERRLLGTEPGGKLESFKRSFKEAWRKVPSTYRKSFADDFSDFMTSDFSGNEIVNVWQDMNAKGGAVAKQFKGVKDVLQSGLQKISPELADRFKQTTSLAERFYKVAGKLQPGKFDNALNLVEVGSIAHGAVKGMSEGNFNTLVSSLKSVAGIKAIRGFARSMITNPRYQNLLPKLISAINQNKAPAINAVMNLLTKEMEKDKVDPSIISIYESIDLD